MLPVTTFRPYHPDRANAPVQFGRRAKWGEYEEICDFLDSQGLDGDKLEYGITFVQDHRHKVPDTFLGRWKIKRQNAEYKTVYDWIMHQARYTDLQPWGGVLASFANEREADEHIRSDLAALDELKREIGVRNRLDFDLVHLKWTPTQVLNLYTRRGTFPVNFVPPAHPAT